MRYWWSTLLTVAGLLFALIVAATSVLSSSGASDDTSTRLDALASRRSGLETDLSRLPANAEQLIAPYTIKGSNDSAATTYLESVRRRIIAAGGALSRSEAKLEPLASSRSKVTITFNGQLTESSLVKFALAIETSAPAMIFEAIDVKPASNGSPTLDVAGSLVGFSSDAG